MDSKFNDLMPMDTTNSQELSVIKEKTDKQIQQGLECQTASTGTPIKDLSGGALFMAQLSNIGGGSLETGGGGIKEGFNTIAANIAVTTTLSNLPESDKENTTYIECDMEDQTTSSD